jgi:hypothetical protein
MLSLFSDYFRISVSFDKVFFVLVFLFFSFIFYFLQKFISFFFIFYRVISFYLQKL